MYKETTNRDIRLAEAAMSTQSAKIHGRCNTILNQSGLKEHRFNHSTNCDDLSYVRGTQREYSSKPLEHSIVKRILVFKR